MSFSPGLGQLPALLFLILLPNHLASQTYKFTRLGIGDGLSQSIVNEVIQDSRGFLWFATEDGLNLYDGYEFKYFRNNPDNENSLSHSWIWDIMEDKNQNLWVGTWYGLNKFSPDRQKITRYLPDPDSPGSIRGNRPISICEDIKGNIWIATWGGGLNRYDPVRDSFICFSGILSPDKELPGDFVREIFIDKHQNLWAGSWKGLWKVDIRDPENPGFQHIPLKSYTEPGAERILSMTEDADSGMWIGTLGWGLFHLNYDGTVISSFSYNPDNPIGIASNDISCLYSEKENLFIGTVSTGLHIFNKNSSSFTHILNDPENPESLAGNNITCIYRDRSGLVWIGAGGLNIFNPSLDKFNQLNGLNQIGRTKSRPKDISAIIEDNAGRIWIGTTSNGVYMYQNSGKNQKENQTTQKAFQSLLNSVRNFNISAITDDPDGNIWIGTQGNGLIKFSPKDHSILRLNERNENSKSFGIGYINGMVVEPPSTLWIATYSGGLISYNIKNGQFEKFKHKINDSTSISVNYLLGVFMDSRGELWIASWGGGLIRFNPRSETFKTYLHAPDEPTSLSDNITQTIYETSKNGNRQIWIGTRNGLSSFDPDKEVAVFRNYSQSDGLPGNIINAIQEDKDGNLWLSTNSGLSALNPESFIFRNFEKFDGLQGNEFNARAGIRLRDGRLMFGGVNDFNVFYPDSIRGSTYNPDIAITSFQIFNQEIPFNPDSQHITLSYKENFFSFEFSSLDYTRSLKNQYKYQMSGIDKDWVMANKRRYANYTNINPGSYIFRVTGTNSDGIWSDKVSVFHVRITPPYWQTWWFRVLVFLFILGLIYLFISYRLKKLKEIERLRVNIASDLHDDIGSSLTRIVIHSQQIQTSKDNTKITSSIKKIGQLSREITSTMSDIVWSIDARNDRYVNMVDRMRDFAYNTLSEQDISVKFTERGPERNKKIDVVIRQNLFSIFKESINNIMKHAQASMVEIEIQNTDNEFRMMIRDNGKGFNTGIERKGNGLHNMKMRARRIDAKLEITGSAGTCILLRRKRL